MKRIFVAYALFFFIFLQGCGNNFENPSSDQTTKPQQKQEPSILSAKTLEEAIKFSRPLMSDETDDISPGAALFTKWAIKKLKWTDLQRIERTKYALVMKDPDNERGKRINMEGTLIEIRVEKTEFGKIFHGGIISDNFNVYRFTAVGSTGDLVAKSRGLFSGIVIGTYSYQNSGGGVTHAVYLVGMFDLPENKSKAMEMGVK